MAALDFPPSATAGEYYWPSGTPGQGFAYTYVCDNNSPPRCNWVASGTAYLNLGGGTMTGPITLSGAPSNNLHAATKAYVDSSTPSASTLTGTTLKNTVVNSSLTSVGILTNIETSGYLRGPASFVIDPAVHGNDTGTVVIAGNLQVDGTTTTVNSDDLAIKDLHIIVAKDSSSAANANNAGLIVECGSDTDAKIEYKSGTDSWNFNKPLDVTGNIVVSGSVDGIDISTIPSVYAPKNNAALSGTATAPTITTASDSSINIATTAFVQAAITAQDTWARTGTTLSPSTANDVVNIAVAYSGTAASSFGGTVSGATPTASGHLTTKAYVDAAAAGAGLWNRSSATLSPATANDVVDIAVNYTGTSTSNFSGPIKLLTTKDGIAGSSPLTIDVSELQFKIHNPADDTNEGVGIGFGVSATGSNVGAAIVHQRLGSQSYGNLCFATKASGAAAGADLPVRLTIDQDGDATFTGNVSAATPTASGHLTTKGYIDSQNYVKQNVAGQKVQSYFTVTRAGDWCVLELEDSNGNQRVHLYSSMAADYAGIGVFDTNGSNTTRSDLLLYRGGNMTWRNSIVFNDGMNLLPATDSTYDLGSTSKRFANVYADEFHGNGISEITGNATQLLLHPGTTAETIIVRNDGADFYFLIADATAAPSSSWNALRPFYIDTSSGMLHSNNGQTFLGGTSVGDGLTIASGVITHTTDDSFDKIRVWGNGSHTIGMKSAQLHGDLNDWAMTFTMNNESDRGFLWRDTAHNDSSGAMSLSTRGALSVSRGINVGRGESNTSYSDNVLFVDNSWQTSNNANYTTCILDIDWSGTSAFSTNRYFRSFRIDSDFAKTGTTSTSGNRAYHYGVDSDVRATEFVFDQRGVYGFSKVEGAGSGIGTQTAIGVYGYTQAYAASGAVNGYGGHFLAYRSRLTNSGTMYGVYARAHNIDDSQSGTNPVGSLIGVYGEVENDIGTCGNGYAFYAKVDRDGGTLTTGYLYYGDYEGSGIGTKWGIFLSDCTQSWIEGSLTCTDNITAYSDIKLKDNIKTIDNALDKVCSLRGVEFNRIDLDGKPRNIGVIAQEVEEVIPEVIINHRDRDEDGEETDEITKSVAYGNLTALLIEAVKELKAEIQTLKEGRS